MLELHRPYRTNPAANLGPIGLVHVEEMCHDGLHNRLGVVIWLHGHNATKDLDRSAIPVFDDIVVRGKPRVDERAKVFTDRLTSIPFGDAKATRRVLYKAIKTFAEGLFIDLFPKSQQPRRRCGLRDC
jgi:hypothetical protein